MYPRPGERGGTFNNVIASALPLSGGVEPFLPEDDFPQALAGNLARCEIGNRRFAIAGMRSFPLLRLPMLRQSPLTHTTDRTVPGTGGIGSRRRSELGGGC